MSVLQFTAPYNAALLKEVSELGLPPATNALPHQCMPVCPSTSRHDRPPTAQPLPPAHLPQLVLSLIVPGQRIYTPMWPKFPKKASGVPPCMQGVGCLRACRPAGQALEGNSCARPPV